MRETADFLVEIQTEELPPKALLKLAKAFLYEIEDRLQKSELKFTESQFFATPRRLAVLIKNLTTQQKSTVVEKKGPALAAAFDKDGKPSPACMGFTKSCGITPDQLITIKNNGGEWVGYQQPVAGKSVEVLLPIIIQQALQALPIPKRMRWGNHAIEFARPVHSCILLLDNKIIEAEILGCKTGRKTRGHRFMSGDEFEIKNPSDYADLLKKHFVIADFSERKKIIREQAEKSAAEISATALISDELLDEVTGLVEWPVAIMGQFDDKFLTVPQEALISAMQDHQRYFPVVDNNKKLLAKFIAISNINSKNPTQLIAGNERVLRARLSDAAFFFEVDKKNTLDSRIDSLKNVIFQAKLGTLYDKAQRLSNLTGFIAKQLGLDENLAKRAGYLAKTDLTSQLVGEFPELQGIAGYYYALHDGEEKSVAIALNEQYMPRFSGDALPTTPLGYALAIADRLDILVGVFGINQAPTGDKDPLGLRRAALGVLRILIEKKLNIDLRELLEFAVKNYSVTLENKNCTEDALNFMLERLKPFYQDQGISADVLASVTALHITKPYDLHCRIQAVSAFKQLAEAESLSIANKRVSNILAKYDSALPSHDINETLFETEAERVLAAKLKEQQSAVIALSQTADYQKLLSQLAYLREPVDNFFDQVLVMTDDKERRENRLLLLKKLRELFLHVADIALLQH